MGEDKGLLPFQGKPMVQHVIEALDHVFPEVTLISQNPDYDQFGKRRIEDLVSEKGPMAGIYTGLRDSPYDLNFFISCDTPFVSIKTLEYLIGKALKMQITVSVIENKLQPLCTIYPKSISRDLEEMLLENRLKLALMIAELPHQKISLEELGGYTVKEFRNINTKAELEELTSDKVENRL
jgi:molybdopterin-guanine dinucleotide biosynthesis protein A